MIQSVCPPETRADKSCICMYPPRHNRSVSCVQHQSSQSLLQTLCICLSKCNVSQVQQDNAIIQTQIGMLLQFSFNSPFTNKVVKSFARVIVDTLYHCTPPPAAWCGGWVMASNSHQHWEQENINNHHRTLQLVSWSIDICSVHSALYPARRLWHLTKYIERIYLMDILTFYIQSWIDLVIFSPICFRSL